MFGTFHGWKWCALLAVLASAGCSKPDQTDSSENPAAESDRQGVVKSVVQVSAAPRPAGLDKFIAELCSGAAVKRPEALLTADFNADGKTDYVLSEDRLCMGSESGWGKAGPLNEFLVSSPTGYALFQGFSSFLEQADIKTRATGDVIQFEWGNTSAGSCDGTFTVTWSWNGTKMDLTDRRNAKGQKVDSMGCPASASGSLPIKLGYYGYADDGCAVALRSNTGGITISDKYWGDIDGDYPIRPVRDLGGGRYRLGEAVDMIRVTGPDSFVADEGTEYERRFIWCAAKAPK